MIEEFFGEWCAVWHGVAPFGPQGPKKIAARTCGWTLPRASTPIDLLPKARLMWQVGGMRSRVRFRRLPFDRAGAASIEIAPRRGGRVIG